MSLPCSRCVGAPFFAAVITFVASVVLVLPVAADAAIPLDLSDNMGSAITFSADDQRIGHVMDAAAT
jgi:hypothetical protein